MEPIVNALSATGDAVKALPYAGKVASAIGQGAVMGSVYGGTQADVGEEGKGLLSVQVLARLLSMASIN